MFSCLSACVFLFCLLYVAVCSTSLGCAVRSVSKTLAREYLHLHGLVADDVCVFLSTRSLFIQCSIFISLLPGRSSVHCMAYGGWCVCTDLQTHSTYTVHLSFSLLPGRSSVLARPGGGWCVYFSPNALYLYSATLSLPLLPGRSSVLAWPGGGWCVCTYLQTHSTYIVQLCFSLLPGRSSVFARPGGGWCVCLILQTYSTYSAALSLPLLLICTCMAWWRLICVLFSKLSLLIQCSCFKLSLTHRYLHGLVVVDVCVYVSKRSLLIVQLCFSLTGSFICICTAWWRLMCVSFSPNVFYL